MEQSPLPDVPPRSKFEALYRELVIEYQQLQATNEALAEQQRDIIDTLSKMPATLRTAMLKVVLESANEGNRQILDAANALAAAKEDLQQMHHRLEQWSVRNTLWLAAVAGASALIGGLLSILFIQG